MKKQSVSYKTEEQKETKVGNEVEKQLEPKLVSLGWFLLLFCGLGFMLPEQMRPLLQWSVYGVTLQMFVGVAALVVALNFLLKD